MNPKTVRSRLKRMFTVKGAFYRTSFAALVICWTMCALAREGFIDNPKMLPPKLRPAWDSIFFIKTETTTKIDTGSSFLVSKIIQKEFIDYFFVTNNHVIKSCPQKGLCPSAILSQNLKIPQKSMSFLDNNDLNGIIFDQVEVLARSKNPDLALLKVSIPRAKAYDLLPIPLSKSCSLTSGQVLFGMGFPDLNTRKSYVLKEELPLRKVWSKGVFTENLKSDDNGDENTNYFSATTVDTLDGGSGGALLNSVGEAVGVMKGNPDNSDGHYEGNEDPEHYDWQSVAVRCELLKEFLNKSMN